MRTLGRKGRGKLRVGGRIHDRRERKRRRRCKRKHRRGEKEERGRRRVPKGEEKRGEGIREMKGEGCGKSIGKRV